MAKERTSVRMQTQIKIMSEQGHSIRTIARVLRAVARARCASIWSPCQSRRVSGGGWEEKVDWEYVRQEVNGKGTTVKQIGREVAPEIEYVKFWRAFREQIGPQASPTSHDSVRSQARRRRPRSISATGLLDHRSADVARKR